MANPKPGDYVRGTVKGKIISVSTIGVFGAKPELYVKTKNEQMVRLSTLANVDVIRKPVVLPANVGSIVEFERTLGSIVFQRNSLQHGWQVAGSSTWYTDSYLLALAQDYDMKVLKEVKSRA